jgi:hypothetical protein
MSENRTEKISVLITPRTLAKLDAYRAAHRWTRSTAAAVLIEQQLEETGEEGGVRGAR